MDFGETLAIGATFAVFILAVLWGTNTISKCILSDLAALTLIGYGSARYMIAPMMKKKWAHERG